MKHIASLFLLLASIIGVQAQTISVLPQMMPAGGTYEDYVDVTCTFPEGCTGGKFWFNGGAIDARNYDGPIRIEKSTTLSIAGVNNDGFINTDIVTYDFTIAKVTKPFITADPEENSVRESFYVTKIMWNNANDVSLNVDAFKEGGSRQNENVVWLTHDDKNKTVATGGSNALWVNGNNSYKAYIYKDYRPVNDGKYTLHIAGGVFTVNGQLVEDELALTYYVGATAAQAPIFNPASGTYQGKVQVSITYPSNVFYQMYKINGGSTESYDGPIVLNESATIEAWGRSEDFEFESEHATASYTVIPAPKPSDVLPSPVITRNGNTITITEDDKTATIKYWFDDKMSTAKIYNAPFDVTKNGKISVVAYRENGVSPTVDYTISHFQAEDTEFGTSIVRTPSDWESVHLTGMSPNGRFVSGYIDTSGSPFGFIWDITSGSSKFISNTYYNATIGVSNDGTIAGWRVNVDPITGEMKTNVDDITYGYYRNNEWTPNPAGMTVNGITGDNKLYGSLNGAPAIYDITTGETTILGGGNGTINCVNSDGTVFAGKVNGTAAYWNASTTPITIATDKACSVLHISGNGKWMLLDNSEWGAYCPISGYRHNTETGKTETITSMGAEYPSRYEWMHTITNDGTMFGVYDKSLISHESGIALAYTTDGIWMSVEEMLYQRGISIDGVSLLSCNFVSDNQDTFVMNVFPADVSSDDAFNYAIALRLNAQVKHGAPVSLEAHQMYGMKAVKLTWDAPVTDDGGVKLYKVLRNNNQIGTTTECLYYDNNVENDAEYTYSIVAVFNDGVESAPSYPVTLRVSLPDHMPARNLALRQSGINDVNLSWASPIAILPKLQYFNEEGEFAAFGTANFNSEWGVRIPASDLDFYKDMEMRTFQFLPTGPQAGYEIRLYKGTPGTRSYDAEPFYTQRIDPQTVKYGTVNTIALNTNQPLPLGKDLIIGLYIEQVGNDNMLGISHDGFKAGYTDLCRIDGVYDTFISISEESSVTTEIVVPLGVGLGNEASTNASIVDKYEISDNGTVIGTTSEISFRKENVAEGAHTFSVRALYKDGEYSVPVSISENIAKNEKAFVPVSDVEVTVNGDNTANITWSAPLNDDRTDIHWGDLTPSTGVGNYDYPIYLAASVYPVTLTNTYADKYEITDIFYYPTANAYYTITLDNDNNDIYFYGDHEPVLNQINYVKLDEPVTIDQSTNYRIVIDVNDCPYGAAPLAFDSSNQSSDGYSNLINVGLDWMTLSEVVQIDEKPNWLMGLVIREKDARQMPLQGYKVIIDDKVCNTDVLTECSFVTAALNNGIHKAAVDVVYDSTRTVRSEAKSFEVVADGIENITTENDAKCYDLQGRRIINDKQGRGIFIIGNKKHINK